jgi:alpha-glucosidase
VIYEIYPRSFQDSNGDGVGDLNGMTQRLDYLKDLGVDAIWITPFFPSPNYDFGYDVADYTNVAPEYGTMADWDRLVAQAANAASACWSICAQPFLVRTSLVQGSAHHARASSATGMWHDPAPDGGPPAIGNRSLADRHGRWMTRRANITTIFLPQQPDSIGPIRPAPGDADVMRFWLRHGAAGFGSMPRPICSRIPRGPMTRM